MAADAEHSRRIEPKAASARLWFAALIVERLQNEIIESVHLAIQHACSKN